MDQETKTSSKKSLWMRLGLKVSSPDLITGVFLGIGLVITAQVLFTFDIAIDVLVVAAGIIVVFFVGAFSGYYLFKHYSSKAIKSIPENPEEIQDLVFEIATFSAKISSGKYNEKDKELLKKRLNKGSPFFYSLCQAIWAAVLRAVAFGRLVAILGGVVSFSIFLATYMQVEKLEIQNKLIETSNHLQEASRRALLVSEIQEINLELSAYSSNGKDNIKLSLATLENIANLSAGLRPYRFLEYGEPDFYKSVGIVTPIQGAGLLSKKALSPERGRLLLRVLRLNPENLSEFAEVRPDFSYSDFRGFQISHLNFSGLVMNSSDFRDSEGFTAVFNSSQLDYSNFTGAELIGVDFTPSEKQISSLRYPHTNLRGAIFVNARLNHAKFDKADLEGADFSNSVLFGASFNNANLRNVNWEGAAVFQADTVDNQEKAIDDFERIIDLLPLEDQAKWIYSFRYPDADHKYLGDDGDDTVYLFFSKKM
ncbi:pentapeptide repeat-containing protein [Acanthopleuribacter pedis]|uniref:Pentapeptide repeat-containing protein n=1 Tax=Acanthopleuribacter pedis TaxID=442870 RepID=A0A8J7U3K9_9BACT|nr:pentapeptide repeat-containing protein [Acanthopleuribacter pedis]MBO1317361.1 pentapeptide repeat-containing protein [Acanthopleuribacter pedis]MBO1318668.1 pentapeptide repeat-containing protein [Acanthopleuribacter pedis]